MLRRSLHFAFYWWILSNCPTLSVLSAMDSSSKHAVRRPRWEWEESPVVWAEQAREWLEHSSWCCHPSWWWFLLEAAFLSIGGFLNPISSNRSGKDHDSIKWVTVISFWIFIVHYSETHNTHKTQETYTWLEMDGDQVREYKTIQYLEYTFYTAKIRTSFLIPYTIYTYTKI